MGAVHKLLGAGQRGSAECGKSQPVALPVMPAPRRERKAFPELRKLRRILLPGLATLAIATIVQVRERGH